MPTSTTSATESFTLFRSEFKMLVCLMSQSFWSDSSFDEAVVHLNERSLVAISILPSSASTGKLCCRAVCFGARIAVTASVFAFGRGLFVNFASPCLSCSTPPVKRTSPEIAATNCCCFERAKNYASVSCVVSAVDVSWSVEHPQTLGHSLVRCFITHAKGGRQPSTSAGSYFSTPLIVSFSASSLFWDRLYMTWGCFHCCCG